MGVAMEWVWPWSGYRHDVGVAMVCMIHAIDSSEEVGRPLVRVSQL